MSRNEWAGGFQEEGKICTKAQSREGAWYVPWHPSTFPWLPSASGESQNVSNAFHKYSLSTKRGAGSVLDSLESPYVTKTISALPLTELEYKYYYSNTYT